MSTGLPKPVAAQIAFHVLLEVVSPEQQITSK